MSSTPDIIDLLAGIQPGSRLDLIRAQRQQARDNAQASYRALFEPANTEQMSLSERFALAHYVAGLHRRPKEAAFYGAKIAELAGTSGWVELITDEASKAASTGPFGNYPTGPLSAEDIEGTSYTLDPAARAALGEKLAAALDHGHLLVFHPRDANGAALQALLDAGWSTTGVVTLSQLIAFLAFQLRVIAGLVALAAA
jgi:CMD domain protein